MYRVLRRVGGGVDGEGRCSESDVKEWQKGNVMLLRYLIGRNMQERRGAASPFRMMPRHRRSCRDEA